MDTYTEIAEQLRDNATQLIDAAFDQGGDADYLAMWTSVEATMRLIATTLANKLTHEGNNRGYADKPGKAAFQKWVKDTFRFSGSDAYQRVRNAEAFAEPTPQPGGRIISRFPETTKAQRAGLLDVQHGRNIRAVMDKIPRSVDVEERDKAEAVLAFVARFGTPEDVTEVGQRILGYLDPDGSLTNDADRARRRTLRLSRQSIDLMSSLSGLLDPQTRALLDVVLAKWASPGFNNPEDDHSLHGPADQPGLDPADVEAAAKHDRRSQEQRNHDALKALLLWTLDTGNLGQHNGFPMHVIVTVTLKELEEQTGVATTATGGVVPVPEVLKMAAHKRYYLCLFDLNGRPLHFSHQRRTANTDQRLALMASERGCTRPGCRVPAMGMQAHHRNRDHAHGSATGIDDLGLACYSDHPVLDENDGVTIPEGWYTRTGAADGPNPGRTEWVPPARVDPERQGRVNNAHRADVLLAEAEKWVAAAWEEQEVYRGYVHERAEAESLAERREHARQMRHSGQACECYDCTVANAP